MRTIVPYFVIAVYIFFFIQFIVLVDNTLFMDEDVNIKIVWLNEQTQNVITAKPKEYTLTFWKIVTI